MWDISPIQALRQCVELLGNYPRSLSVAINRALQLELDKSNNPAATRLKEELTELTEQEKANRLTDAGTPMRLLFQFYVGLIEEREDPAYYGKTVTPEDADKVLLRWRLSDKEYRVIYGGLDVFGTGVSTSGQALPVFSRFALSFCLLISDF
jgi:hypothetical protein